MSACSSVSAEGARATLLSSAPRRIELVRLWLGLPERVRGAARVFAASEPNTGASFEAMQAWIEESSPYVSITGHGGAPIMSPSDAIALVGASGGEVHEARRALGAPLTSAEIGEEIIKILTGLQVFYAPRRSFPIALMRDRLCEIPSDRVDAALLELRDAKRLVLHHTDERFHDAGLGIWEGEREDRRLLFRVSLPEASGAGGRP